MAEMKNICGKIPVELHEKVRAEIEEKETSTQIFIRQVIEEHFNRLEGKGEESMEKRTLAVQVTEELFQRVKWAVTKEGIKQKDFIIRIIEKAVEEVEAKWKELEQPEENAETDRLEEAKETAAADKKVGVFLPSSADDPRWSADGETLQNTLEDDGYDAELFWADEDSDTQVSQIQSILDDEELSALVIAPSDAYSLNDVLEQVYIALTEKGYNPVNQIVGYIMSGDPTYITSHKGARSMIMKVERDELVEELLTEYIKNRSWEY